MNARVPAWLTNRPGRIWLSVAADTSRATSATLARARTSRTFRRCVMPRALPVDNRRGEVGGSVFAECIPDAPHRLDEAGLGGVRLDLVANVADVDVDRPLVGLQRLVV